jgi:methionyl-tRNA formyltransferase
MKVVFFGTPQFAVPTLERLLSTSEIEVVAIVTQPDKRRGRGAELTPSPVKTVALAHQLPVWQPRSVKKDAETLDQLRSAQADAFVVVAYGQILSQTILDMPRWGCINAHGSLLPYYRGAAPIQWSLYHGETETGITTMLMDAGMDTGAMLLKATVAIALLDNAIDLSSRLSALAAGLVVETLNGLEQQTLNPIAQNHAQATYAPLIQKADYFLDWSRPAIALHNQVRGFFPNCIASFRDSALKITATVPLLGDRSQLRSELPSELPSELIELEPLWIDLDQTAAPGTVVGILKTQGAIVQTGKGLLLLREIQLAGKRSQSGSDFVNGARLTIGERLENGR